MSLSVAYLFQLATQYHMDHKSFVRSEFLRQTDNVQSAFTVYDNITKGNCVSFIFFFHTQKKMLNIKLIRLHLFTCTEARRSLILQIFQQSNNQSRAILFFAVIEITHFDRVRNYLDHFRGTKYINILRSQAFEYPPYGRQSSKPASIHHLHIQNHPCDREQRLVWSQQEG